MRYEIIFFISERVYTSIYLFFFFFSRVAVVEGVSGLVVVVCSNSLAFKCCKLSFSYYINQYPSLLFHFILFHIRSLESNINTLNFPPVLNHTKITIKNKKTPMLTVLTSLDCSSCSDCCCCFTPEILNK